MAVEYQFLHFNPGGVIDSAEMVAKATGRICSTPNEAFATTPVEQVPRLPIGCQVPCGSISLCSRSVRPAN